MPSESSIKPTILVVDLSLKMKIKGSKCHAISQLTLLP